LAFKIFFFKLNYINEIVYYCISSSKTSKTSKTRIFWRYRYFSSKSTDKKANALRYSVDSFKDLTTIIIPHFKKYPLITQKAADFILFEQIVELMSKDAHLTINGLHKIINVKASMNLGIS